ncbi:NUMOD4 domain-containing protein [Flavobacterium sp.]|uniref:NUMOD4 domain-containing protein n=1 Tax=Flavobacterium sp. TaxID=239 RepID=UPI0025DFCB23|nr:NUMOD4 domain-containing protein [Flavobacterium sp.]
MKEVWKDMLGYEGLYQVSSNGNIKSLSRTITKGKVVYVTKDKILKQSIDSVGYPYVNLSNYKKQKTFRVHQLVSIAFLNHIPNGYDGLIVDHIDGNKLNNFTNNLQLVTNRKNSSKDRKNKTSNFTGVSWHKQSNKWLAQVRINGKVNYLGVFKKEEDAYLAYTNSIKSKRMYSEKDLHDSFFNGWIYRGDEKYKFQFSQAKKECFERFKNKSK